MIVLHQGAGYLDELNLYIDGPLKIAKFRVLLLLDVILQRP